MGIRYLALQPLRATLLVGGTAFRVGILRDAGPASTANRMPHAPVPASQPRAAIVTGYGEGDDAMVIGWEPGMASVNDLDWAKMPCLGVSRPDSRGQLELYAGSSSKTPLTFDEAVSAGILEPSGALASHRRPRVVAATLTDEVAWTHRNQSSLGDVLERHDVLELAFDNGKKGGRYPLSRRVSGTLRQRVTDGVLNGQTAEDAWDWLEDEVRREQAISFVPVQVLADGRLDFVAGEASSWMFPDYDERRHRFGLFVGGSGGGAGMPVPPENAFSDIGERLARSGAGQPISSASDGYVALQVGGLGMLLIGSENGSVGVACGGSFPREFVRDTAMRLDAPDGARGGAAALEAWEHQMVDVPPSSVGPFLADFSLYLHECSAAAASPGRDVPTFADYLAAHGIAYTPVADNGMAAGP